MLFHEMFWILLGMLLVSCSRQHLQAPWMATKVGVAHFGTFEFGNIRLVPNHSTHKCRAIAVSHRIASIFGLVDATVPVTQILEFHFVDDALKLKLKPDVPPGTLAYAADVDVQTILVLPSLEKDQMVLSIKVGIVPIIGYDMAKLKWNCILEVKDLRQIATRGDTITTLINAVADYNLHISEERYLYARRYIKRLFQDYAADRRALAQMGSAFNSLRFMKITVQLSKSQLTDLWMETLKYNRRYAKGHILLKWFAFLSIGKTIRTDGERLFTPGELRQIIDNVMQRRSVWELKELLKDVKMVRVFSGAAMRAILAKVRGAGYFKSQELAIFLLEHCQPYYTLDWIRQDIITLVALSSTQKRLDSTAVQRFMEFYAETWPGDLSEHWLRMYLNVVRLCKINLSFDEWQGIGYFGTFMWMLHSRLPHYFEQGDWNAFRDAKQQKSQPFADLKDAILETTGLVPLLHIQRPVTSTRYESTTHAIRAVAPIKVIITRIRCSTSAFVVKEAMKALLQAVDFWLQVTGFTDEIVLLQEHYHRAKKLSRSGTVAVALCRELLAAYQYMIMLQANVDYNPAMIIPMLAKLQLPRVTLLMIWSGTVPMPIEPDSIALMARFDVHGLGNAMWAARLVDPERSVEAMAAAAQALDQASEPDAFVFGQLYASVGPPITNPCRLQPVAGRRATIRELSWAAPTALLQGMIGNELAISLLRIYLLLKLGIPLGITRSNLTLIESDQIIPMEYASVMNFWLERHCALLAAPHGSRLIPAYHILIPDADPQDVLIE